MYVYIYYFLAFKVRKLSYQNPEQNESQIKTDKRHIQGMKLHGKQTTMKHQHDASLSHSQNVTNFATPSSVLPQSVLSNMCPSVRPKVANREFLNQFLRNWI